MVSISVAIGEFQRQGFDRVFAFLLVCHGGRDANTIPGALDSRGWREGERFHSREGHGCESVVLYGFRTLASGGAAEPAAQTTNGSCYIAHGSRLSTLRSMESQRAGVVRRVLRESHRQVSPEEDESRIEKLFKEAHRYNSTDLHPSMLSATRAETQAAPRWRAAHLRCGLHRVRTAELVALGHDALTDSFFLNVTLSLKGPSAMTALRRRSQAWMREHVRVCKGALPEGARQWREAVTAPLRRRIAQGNATKADVQRLHVYDALYTGDGRKHDVVEHYHNEHCSGNDDECVQRCCVEGLRDFLRQAPTPYNRRSWHGHGVTVDHVILWQATHGLLGSNYGAVVDQTKKNLARRAAASGGHPGAAADPSTNGGHAGVADASAASLFEPGVGGSSSGLSASEMTGARLAQEEEDRCRSVQEYCRRPDHFLRMLRYREFLRAGASVKWPLLVRAGPGWEANQWSKTLSGQEREYRLSAAFDATELLEGMRTFSSMGSGDGVHCRAWYPSGGAAGLATESAASLAAKSSSAGPVGPPAQDLQQLRVQTFVMAASGGGALYDLGYKEQQRYPQRALHILTDPHEGVDALLHDAERHPHVLDSTTAGHVQSYSTKRQLESTESMSTLECVALVGPDTTQIVEQDHAHVKRARSCREQTYKEDLGFCSAWRVLDSRRHLLDTSSAARLREEMPGRGGVAGPAVEPAGSGGVAGPPAEPAERRKTRKRSTWQAWCSLYGGWVASEKMAAYRRDMQDAAVRARCERQAVIVTAARRWGQQPKRTDDRRLRQMREASRRTKKAWNRGAALRNLRLLDMCPFRTGRRRALRQWVQVRKQQRDEAKAYWRELHQFNRDVELPDVLRPFQQDLVAHPAQHAACAFEWVPETRPETERRLPGAIQREQLDRTAQWDIRHDLVPNCVALPIPRVPIATLRRNRCLETCRCFCRAEDRPRALLVDRWHQCLSSLLKKPTVTIRALRGDNERRTAADTGKLVISFEKTDQGEEAIQWYHLSHVRYQPCRPVLMRLTGATRSGGPGPAAQPAVAELAGETVLQPAWIRTDGGQEQHWWWILGREAFTTTPLEHPLTMRLHMLMDVSRDSQGRFVLTTRPFQGACRTFWAGEHAMAGEIERQLRKERQQEDEEKTTSSRTRQQKTQT